MVADANKVMVKTSTSHIGGPNRVLATPTHDGNMQYAKVGGVPTEQKSVNSSN